MSAGLWRRAVAFGTGLLFALGLGVSGMTSPAKIFGFLDVTRAWDPSLLCVMAAALAVFALAYRRVIARGRPRFERRFWLSELTAIDARLLGGAALFGIGWGLSGYCPGPAIVALVTGRPSALGFGATMLASAAVVRAVLARRAPGD